MKRYWHQRQPVEQMYRFVPLLLVVALAAWTSTGCDPSRAGFLEGIGCANGGYQQRQQILGQGLAQAQANELQQKAQATSAANSASAAQNELAARRRKIAQLDAGLADLRRKLQIAADHQGPDQRSVHDASIRVAELIRQQDAAKRDPMAANLQDIEDRQHKLVKLLDELE